LLSTDRGEFVFQRGGVNCQNISYRKTNKTIINDRYICLACGNSLQAEKAAT
jgi:hypothetical protein